MRESVYICGQKPVRAAVALRVGIIGLLVCFSVSQIPVSKLIAAIVASHNIGKYSFSSGSFQTAFCCSWINLETLHSALSKNACYLLFLLKAVCFTSLFFWSLGCAEVFVCSSPPTEARRSSCGTFIFTDSTFWQKGVLVLYLALAVHGLTLVPPELGLEREPNAGLIPQPGEPKLQS